MENDKLILVYYISVKHMDMEDIAEYMYKVREKINIPGFDGHSIFVPVLTDETRIECINPKYVTDENLINEHNTLMKELNEKLELEIQEFKNKKNG